MSEKISAVVQQRGLEKRAGSSRKLLARKAREKAQATSGASLESCFPRVFPLIVPPDATGQRVGDDTTVPPAPAAPLPATSCRHLTTGPRLRPGEITPNAGTVVAAIVRLVVERGELSRTELIDLMSEVSFDHPKSRAAEKGWSQGYVAGAIRAGYLAVADEPSPDAPNPAPGLGGQPC